MLKCKSVEGRMYIKIVKWHVLQTENQPTTERSPELVWKSRKVQSILKISVIFYEIFQRNYQGKDIDSEKIRVPDGSRVESSRCLYLDNFFEKFLCTFPYNTYFLWLTKINTCECGACEYTNYV